MRYLLDTNTTLGDTTIQTIISNKKPIEDDEERQIKVHLSAIDNAHEKIKLDIIELNKLFELNKARFNLITPISKVRNDTTKRIPTVSPYPTTIEQQQQNKDKTIIEKGMIEMRDKLNDLKHDMQQLDIHHQNKMKDLKEKNSNDIKYNLLNESNIRKIVETKLQELYNMSPMKELNIYRSKLNKQHEHVMSVLGSLEGKYDTVKSKVNCVKCNHTKYVDPFSANSSNPMYYKKDNGNTKIENLVAVTSNNPQSVDTLKQDLNHRMDIVEKECQISQDGLKYVTTTTEEMNIEFNIIRKLVENLRATLHSLEAESSRKISSPSDITGLYNEENRDSDIDCVDARSLCKDKLSNDERRISELEQKIDNVLIQKTPSPYSSMSVDTLQKDQNRLHSEIESLKESAKNDGTNILGLVDDLNQKLSFINKHSSIGHPSSNLKVSHCKHDFYVFLCPNIQILLWYSNISIFQLTTFRMCLSQLGHYKTLITSIPPNMSSIIVSKML